MNYFVLILEGPSIFRMLGVTEVNGSAFSLDLLFKITVAIGLIAGRRRKPLCIFLILTKIFIQIEGCVALFHGRQESVRATIMAL